LASLNICQQQQGNYFRDGGSNLQICIEKGSQVELVGVDGALGCDGAMRLQFWHCSLSLMMHLVIPGQKMLVSALAVMAGLLWCAA